MTRATDDRRVRPAGHPPLWRRLVLLTAVLLLVAAACSGDDDDAAETASFDEEASSASASAMAEGDDFATDDAEFADEEAMEEAAEDAMADEPASAEGGEPSALGSGGATVTPTAADLGRKLIFTADLTVEVDDVAAAGAEATAIIEGLGGFVFGQDTSGGAEPFSRLTFKVRPDDFNRALEQLGDVGELRSQTVTTDDVTERIVDLESRIEVAELGVDRLRAALEGSQSLEDYAELERLLLERESDLEVMRGSLRTLEDRVDLATITLLLTQDRVDNAIELAISAYEGHDGGQGCPTGTGDEGRFRVAADTEVTLCLDIVNLGDQTLTDIALTDTVLDITSVDQLIPVFGSIEELAPGQSVLVAFETKPERDLQIRPRVTAVPTDGVSDDPAGPSVNTQRTYTLDTFEPERDPGFGDGFGAGVDILRGLWVAFTVIVGFLIPMLVLLPLLWLAWMGLRRLRARQALAASRRTPAFTPAPPMGRTPPPPAPTKAPDESATSTADADSDADDDSDASADDDRA